MGASARTIEFWFSASSWHGSLSDDEENVVGYGNTVNPPGNEAADVWFGAVGTTLNLTGWGNRVGFTLPSPMQDGLWHQVALTYDGSTTVTAYYDGASIGKGTLPGGALNTQSGGLLLGQSPPSQSQGPYGGLLQEVAIYPTAVSAARVRAHYAEAPLHGPGAAEILTGGYPYCAACIAAQTPRPVNTATGNFWHSFNDIGILGRGIPLSLVRTYNSANASVNGRFGYGWNDSYSSSVTFDGSQNASVLMEDGSTVPFKYTSPTWKASPHTFATFVKNGDGTYTLTAKSGEQHVFSLTGQLTKVVDRNGYATTLNYTGSQLTTVTDPAGRTLTLSYTGSNVRQVQDSSRSVGYLYDGSGNLQQVTDVNGGVTTFTYDGSHRLLTTIDPVQNASSQPQSLVNHYDAQARVDRQTDPMGLVTTFDYTGVPGATKVTDPAGKVTLYSYSNLVLIAVTKGYGTPQAATWTYLRDMNTLTINATVDPNGNVTQQAYDDSGNLARSTDALGRTTSYTYNSLNEPQSQTDALGAVSTFTYDIKGNLLWSCTPLTGTCPATQSQLTCPTSTTLQITCYTYGDTSHPGDVTQMTDPLTKNWAYTYDTYGDRQTAADPLGNKTLGCFDTIGRRTAVVTPKGTSAGVVHQLFPLRQFRRRSQLDRSAAAPGEAAL
jgi:YD repeat-containing protein